ncbi:hypothetical protein BVRB_2g039320 [Beta vulgaris subsp. vulgaris]|nr:hypothetical protein BVRB_2g039320 [Beta vulgaris subsp. vulgaris]
MLKIDAKNPKSSLKDLSETTKIEGMKKISSLHLHSFVRQK